MTSLVPRKRGKQTHAFFLAGGGQGGKLNCSCSHLMLGDKKIQDFLMKHILVQIYIFTPQNYTIAGEPVLAICQHWNWERYIYCRPLYLVETIRQICWFDKVSTITLVKRCLHVQANRELVCIPLIYYIWIHTEFIGSSVLFIGIITGNTYFTKQTIPMRTGETPAALPCQPELPAPAH